MATVAVDPRTEYLLRLGDDALVLGQRVSEWCGHGPVLEVDISLANLSLDLIGQATLLLGEAGDGDKLAFHRDVLDFRNCLLVEQPNGDFGQTIARQLLFSTYQHLLYERLAESSDGFVRRALEMAEQHLLPGREQQLPRDRPAKIAIGLLDKQAISKIEHVAVKGKLVGIPRRAKQVSRLPHQVEREIGQAEIDLERRRVAAPFTQPLAEDQRVVTQAQQVISARVDRDRRHQMCFTSSGMS